MNNQLTVNDPVSKETLEKMREAHEMCLTLENALMIIEQEKIDIMVKYRTINAQYKKLMGHEMSIRGIPSDSIVEIDKNTGVLTVRTPSAT